MEEASRSPGTIVIPLLRLGVFEVSVVSEYFLGQRKTHFVAFSLGVNASSAKPKDAKKMVSAARTVVGGGPSTEKVMEGISNPRSLVGVSLEPEIWV
jgi:hypothetical protein